MPGTGRSRTKGTQRGEKKIDLGIRKFPAKHAGKKHQMVIVDPYHVSPFPVFGNLASKSLVDPDVISPGMVLQCLALRVVGHLIMKDEPQDLFTEAPIVSFEVLVRAEYGQCIVVCGQPPFNVPFLLCVLQKIGERSQNTDTGFVWRFPISCRCLGCVTQTPVAVDASEEILALDPGLNGRLTLADEPASPV